MKLQKAAAWTFTGVSAVVMLFHVAIMFGAPLGHLTMGGRWPGVLPPAARLLSAMSLLAMAAMVVVVLARARVLDRHFSNWWMRCVLAYLALAIVMHVATPSPAERTLWLPVIVALSLSAIWVEVGARKAER